MAADLRLQYVSATNARYLRRAFGQSPILEQDTVTYDALDEFRIAAFGGTDLIDVDLAFANFGTVDGGPDADTCTAPDHWIKISC